MTDWLTRKDAEIRSELGARCNIAWAKFKRQELSPQQLKAEVDQALIDRDNKRGDMLREFLKVNP